MLRYVAPIFLLLISACTKKEDYSVKTFTFSMQGKVKGFDPIHGDDRYGTIAIGLVYEGLLEYHHLKRPYELIPNLAVEIPKPTENGKVYTFKIKKGVFFRDSPAFKNGKGRELEAKDFEFSLRRLADPKLISTGWWVFDGKIAGLNEWRKKYLKSDKADYSDPVKGIRVIDKYTLRLELSKPFPQFLYALSMPFSFVVPIEAVTHYGKEFLNHPVGTGPFLLDKFDQTNKITFLKNPNYREKLYPSEGSAGDKEAGLLEDAGKRIPMVDKIVYHQIPEQQPRLLNFKSGKFDYLLIPTDTINQSLSPSQSLLDGLASRKIKLYKTPALDVTFRAFNNQHKLFKNNMKLRQAIALGVNMKKENKLFYSNTGALAQSIVPPGIAGHIDGYINPFMQYDVAKAKKLLAEAGYPGGKGLPVITYDNTQSSLARRMAEFFQNSMAVLGIKIKPIQNTWPQLQHKIRNQNTMMHGMAWGADYPDGENFLQLLYGPNQSPGANNSNYDDPEYNKLFAKAAMMDFSPERTKLYEQLYKMAAERMPIIYGLHRIEYEMVHGWVRNFKHTEFDYVQYKYMNIDQKVKKKILEENF